MPYTDSGYVLKTEREIIREAEILHENLLGVVNYSISDVKWQWLKNQVYEREEIEALNQKASEMMSISDAAGAFLDKHGIECGILRKGATKSEGYVECTKNIDKASFTIAKNTQFKSPTKTYKSDEANIIPYIIRMTKGKTGESDDYFESTIYYVESIEKILDENNNVIDSSYYSLDSTYNNNVQWTEESEDIIIENEEYTVYVSGNVTKRVEVASVETGVDANATIGTVTTCVEYPSLSVTNNYEITGGSAKETDSTYKNRLLQARRRTFTLGSIRSIIMGLDGVRACHVYQDRGVDQSSVSDWDNPELTEPTRVYGTGVLLSQSFVPGDQIATLGRITVHGMTNNDPPALVLGVKPDTDGVSADYYYDYVAVERYEIDQSITGMRDIHFDVQYNNIDKTKTYRFDLWCEDPNSAGFDWNTHYWLLDVTTEGYRSDNRGAFRLMSGGAFNIIPNDLMFKTWFNGAGFTAVIAPDDGYGFSGLRTQINTYLDYIDGGGYSPICIQSSILEADEVEIDVQATVYITSTANWNEVRTDIVTKIEEYLEGLNIGDNVIYAEFIWAIMEVPLVTNVKDVYIKRSTSTTWTQNDIGILDDEVSDLGARSFQLGS